MSERKNETDLFVYGIAKQIADYANDNSEVDAILESVRRLFEMSDLKRKPEIPPYPIDWFGNRILMPKDKSKGTSDERRDGRHDNGEVK